MRSFLEHYIKCCIDSAPVAKNINSASTFLKSIFLVSQPFVNLFSGMFAINLDKCLFILLCSSFISARILCILFHLCCRHFYLIDKDYYKVYFIFKMILIISSSIFAKGPLRKEKLLQVAQRPWTKMASEPNFTNNFHIYRIYIYSIYKSRTCIQ